MTTHIAVPADIEPESMVDLVEDCREVSGMLAPFVIDLRDIPLQGRTVPFTIPAQTADALAGYEEYGS